MWIVVHFRFVKNQGKSEFEILSQVPITSRGRNVIGPWRHAAMQNFKNEGTCIFNQKVRDFQQLMISSLTV